MQPIYCTWEANGATAHTPGLFKRGRVTSARAWINSALGELATVQVQANDSAARDQQWAEATFYPAPGTEIIKGKDGSLTVRRKVSG